LTFWLNITISQAGGQVIFLELYFTPERMWQATSHISIPYSLRYPGNMGKTQRVSKIRNTANSSILYILMESS